MYCGNGNHKGTLVTYACGHTAWTGRWKGGLKPLGFLRFTSPPTHPGNCPECDRRTWQAEVHQSYLDEGDQPRKAAFRVETCGLQTWTWQMPCSDHFERAFYNDHILPAVHRLQSHGNDWWAGLDGQNNAQLIFDEIRAGYSPETLSRAATGKEKP